MSKVVVNNKQLLGRLVKNRGGSVSAELPKGRFIVPLDALGVDDQGRLVVDHPYFHRALEEEGLLEKADTLAWNVNCNC